MATIVRLVISTAALSLLTIPALAQRMAPTTTTVTSPEIDSGAGVAALALIVAIGLLAYQRRGKS